jgi:hypothetical protein
MICWNAWGSPTRKPTATADRADYANADAVEQQAFLESFTRPLLASGEPTAVVAFDEFSVCEKPPAAYGWADKNTRPTFKTDEKKGSVPTAS